MPPKKTTKNLDTEIKPTHFDFQAEQSLLGSILVCGKYTNEVMGNVCLIITDHEFFYDEKHQHIFLLMKLLWQSNIEIDITAIMDINKDFGNHTQIEITQKDLLILGAKASLLTSTKTACEIIKRMHHERNILKMVDKIKNSIVKAPEMEEMLVDIQNELDAFKLNKDNTIIKSYAEMFSEDEFEKQMNRANDKNFKPDIKTDIPKLDSSDVLFAGGELTIIAGQPGMGKTALTILLMKNFVEKKINNLFFSLEMTEPKIKAKMVAFEAGINPKVYEKLGFEGSESATRLHKDKIIKAIDFWGKNQGSIVYEGCNITNLIETIKIAHKKKPLDIVMIDQLTMIDTGTMFRPDDLKGSMSYSINKLKKLAKELNIPIVLLHQLRKPSAGDLNRRPNKADLKETGKAVETPDCILLLHKDVKTNVYEIIVAKNRNGQADLVCEFSWDAKLARITY